MSVRVSIEPDGEMPENLMVNGHLFVHVAACPCPAMQREVERLDAQQRGGDWKSCADPDCPHAHVAHSHDSRGWYHGPEAKGFA